MANFNLDDYETVESRIEKFWVKYPDGRIATNLVKSESNEFIILAAIYADREAHHPIATGYAHEVQGVGMVNKTSALENCETSAIGRALANGGFATSGKRASRSEMEKVQRGTAKPAEAPKQKALTKPKPTQESNFFEIVAQVEFANSQDELKAIWHENSEILDVETDGQTLRSVIMKRKEELV